MLQVQIESDYTVYACCLDWTLVTHAQNRKPEILNPSPVEPESAMLWPTGKAMCGELHKQFRLRNLLLSLHKAGWKSVFPTG